MWNQKINLILFLFSCVSFAADTITVQGSIETPLVFKNKGETREAFDLRVLSLHRDLCVTWKKTTSEKLKGKVDDLDLSCGEPRVYCGLWLTDGGSEDSTWAGASYRSVYCPGADRLQYKSHSVVSMRPKSGKASVFQETLHGAYGWGRLSDAELIDWVEPSYQKSCSNWKARLEKRFGQSLLFADCGEEKYTNDYSIVPRYTYEPEFHPNARENIAKQAYFSGVFVVGGISVKNGLEKNLSGGEVAFSYGDIVGEFEAIRGAQKKFNDRCNKWKTTLEQKFGDALVYATCEPKSDSRQSGYISESHTSQQFYSTGMFFLKDYP